MSHEWLLAGEPWSDAVLGDLAVMSDEQRDAWRQLLAHAATASAARPSKKWLREAKSLIAATGESDFVQRAGQWLELVDASAKRFKYFRREMPVDPLQKIVELNAAVLKGLAWCGIECPKLCGPITELAEKCLKKIPNYGPRSKKAGNACIVALSAIGEPGIVGLVRLHHKVRYASAQKMLTDALDNAAAAAGMTKTDLEELAVPDFGLDPDGPRRIECGEWTALVQVTGAATVELSWIKPDGRVQKRVPAAVRRDHTEALKGIRKTVKEIQQMLPAVRGRIERAMMTDPTWSFTDWRRRYLDQPLVSFFARRLIWVVEDCGEPRQCVWLDGGLVGADGQPFGPISDAAIVRLWHPMDSPLAEIRGWHELLARHEIGQPFKQAHREVYVLTDAERRSADHSDRFARHILKQHQLAALCRERGWSYRLQGPWDGANDPTWELPELDLRVSFEVEECVELAERYSHRAVPLYITSRGVCFQRLSASLATLAQAQTFVESFALRLFEQSAADSAEESAENNARLVLPEALGRIQLDAIPKRVFSEVMRNVELFVSSCSVANDPQWLNQNSERADWREYWLDHAFGMLTESAQTRRELLITLLPQLKIADRCRLEDRFLVVEGTLRTYKIHLGSANVRMEPDGRYLCVVADHHSRAARLRFVPFEGDTTLSVILSKAFMLAADHKILDPTIRSQIET